MVKHEDLILLDKLRDQLRPITKLPRSIAHRQEESWHDDDDDIFRHRNRQFQSVSRHKH